MRERMIAKEEDWFVYIVGARQGEMTLLLTLLWTLGKLGGCSACVEYMCTEYYGVLVSTRNPRSDLPPS